MNASKERETVHIQTLKRYNIDHWVVIFDANVQQSKYPYFHI